MHMEAANDLRQVLQQLRSQLVGYREGDRLSSADGAIVVAGLMRLRGLAPKAGLPADAGDLLLGGALEVSPLAGSLLRFEALLERRAAFYPVQNCSGLPPNFATIAPFPFGEAYHCACLVSSGASLALSSFWRWRCGDLRPTLASCPHTGSGQATGPRLSGGRSTWPTPRATRAFT